jgi:hypothetical protein
MEYLRLVELSQKASAYPGQLSGGSNSGSPCASAGVAPRDPSLERDHVLLGSRVRGEGARRHPQHCAHRENNASHRHYEVRARDVRPNRNVRRLHRRAGVTREIFGNPRSERTMAFLHSVLNHQEIPMGHASLRMEGWRHWKRRWLPGLSTARLASHASRVAIEQQGPEFVLRRCDPLGQRGASQCVVAVRRVRNANSRRPQRSILGAASPCKLPLMQHSGPTINTKKE